MTARHLTLGIISHERIARSMAGPGIRCWEFARALSEQMPVVLFTPEESDLKPQGFELVTYDKENPEVLAGAASRCDALLAQGFTFNENPALTRSGKFLIVDLYVPITLEAMCQYEHKTAAEQTAIQTGIASALMEQLAVGHFFICASERQRDYWLGWLSAAGRITPEEYARDHTLHRLIDMVPFGHPEEPPVATGKALRGVHPAIGADDKVLLWGGGIYNWLDPFTPIRAMALLAEKRGDVRLFFLGARHPDPNVPAMRAYDEAVELSRELGVLDKHVIFNDQWTAYEDRVNFLLEADLGVNANIRHIETRFSFRTRILDCIWASLPVVSTDGDSLSSLVKHRGLGLVTPSGNVREYADAIERLLDDGELYGRCRANLAEVAREYRWSETTAPLKRCLKKLRSEGWDGAAASGLKVTYPAGDTAGAGGAHGNAGATAPGSIKDTARRLKRKLSGG